MKSGRDPSDEKMTDVYFVATACGTIWFMALRETGKLVSRHTAQV